PLHSSPAAGIIDCPIKLFFTIDTSESIALQESPISVLVDNIIEFTKIFVQRLADEEYRGQIQISWSIGGLYFSQKQVVFSQFTTKENFIRNLGGIVYLGKGTYIDCAVKNMTHHLTQHYTGKRAALFSVVITDGHVTGNPCGGMKVMAERAREKGIHIFSVASSRRVDELAMSEIASSPQGVYRDDYIAVDIVDGRPKIKTESIDRIIQAMVSRNVFPLFMSTLCGLPRTTRTEGSARRSRGNRSKCVLFIIHYSDQHQPFLVGVSALRVFLTKYV
uniref:VWFA domain-containing protein n=1 Tax=Seriola lalandi dorsalis TaxID=1841481 RepID=A0A3B4WVU6_SERLL